jgi:hypothetical protein
MARFGISSRASIQAPLCAGGLDLLFILTGGAILRREQNAAGLATISAAVQPNTASAPSSQSVIRVLGIGEKGHIIPHRLDDQAKPLLGSLQLTDFVQPVEVGAR